MEPLIPVYLSVGVYASLGAPGAPLDPGVAAACSLGCGDRDLCEALLDPLLSRLRRLPGPWAAAVSATLLLEELGGAPRIVYLDVGARLVPARPGGVVLLREAEVVLERRGGVYTEETRHLVAPPYGSLLPLAAGRRAERVRQAARYILELARVYALLREAEGPTIIYKHGPLAELIAIYINPAYDAGERLYRAVLLHAGLDDATADRLIDAAATAAGEVNPGLLAVGLLRGIAAEESRRRWSALAVGVVEDTSGSRLLASTLIAEALYNAARGGLLQGHAVSDAEKVAGLVEKGLSLVKRWRGGCVADPQAWAVDTKDFASELLAALNARALAWGLGLPGLLSRPPLLAAAVYQESSRILEGGDIHLLLDAAYLYGLGVTGPLADAALRGLAGRALDAATRVEPGALEEARRALEELTHLYSYAAPAPLPTCGELEPLASRLGAPPDLLASLSRVKQPLRVDIVALAGSACAAAERLVSAAALVHLAATVSAYGLPPGLIVADVRSRVRLNEALILSELARRLAGRLVPYGLALRHWPRRSATV